MLEIALDVLLSSGGFGLTVMLWYFYPGKTKVIGITAIIILLFFFAGVHKLVAFDEAQFQKNNALSKKHKTQEETKEEGGGDEGSHDTVDPLGKYKGRICFGWICP